MTEQHTTLNPAETNGVVLSFPKPSETGLIQEVKAIRGDGLSGLPSEFCSRADGVYELRCAGEEDQMPVRICSPLVVKGRCRTLDGMGWGLVVSVEDPEGAWHDIVLESRDVAKRSATALNALLDCGLEIAPIEKAAQSVSRLLAAWKPEATYLRASRFGWSDKSHTAFVLGDGRVLGQEKVVTDTVSDEIAASMHAQGTLEAWKTTVAEPCVGNPLMILAMSHAFTGPLLSILGREGGGFHLRGVSSRGKSTLLGVAASVWGAPSFVQSWRGTDNGIEGIAAACNDSLLVIDELHQVDPSIVGDAVYMLANGRGKMRMRSNAANQKTLRWSVPVLSSGELSLEEHMASAGQKTFAGQEIRLIDLVADLQRYGAFDALHGASSGEEFSDILKTATRDCYGVAGPAFVAKLMDAPSSQVALQRFVDGFCRLVREKADLPPDGQVRRVLARFALAAAAGDAATKFGLTGWPQGAALNAARQLFLQWFQNRDGTTKSEIEAAVERTRRYVVKNLGNFSNLHAGDQTVRDGWQDDDWIFVLPDRWADIHANEDPVEIARLHQSAGLLRHQKGGLQFRMPRKVANRPRVYAIRKEQLLKSAGG